MFLRRTTPNIKIEVEAAGHIGKTGLKINDEWRVTGDVIEVPRGSNVKIYYYQGGSISNTKTYIMLNGFRVASGSTSAQYQFSAMESFKIRCVGVASGGDYSFVRMTTQ